MKLLASLAAFLLLSAPSTAQGKPSDIIHPPSNIQYGNSCRDNEILFWLNAPQRGKWLRTIIEVYDGAASPSFAFIGMGFMKRNTIIGYSKLEACTLLVSPSWIIPVTLTNGKGRTNLFLVPNDPKLKGLPLFAQALYTTSDGVVMSRGVQMSMM